MITDIEDFFTKGCGRCERFATPDCSTRLWTSGLNDLRRICLSAGLVETVKWGHPCYVHKGRNIAIFGAFRDDFRITFFNAALMKDPENILEKAGPNTAHAGVIRFKDNAGPARAETIIRAYLHEATGYAEAGMKPVRQDRTLKLPGELLEAFESDPQLEEAFGNLTPGRQKSYVINLIPAKKAETRKARILKFRTKILAGYGATER